MQILKDLINKANGAIKEIERCAEKAHALRHEYRTIADTYIKIAEMHVTIYGLLHDRMVASSL